MSKIKCFFDGACEPANPNGNMGIGAYAIQNGQRIWEFSDAIKLGERGYKSTSNNVAEYLALKACLEWCIENQHTSRVKIFGDSKLVIKQMSKIWVIRGGVYKPIAETCLKLLNHFEDIKFHWIPREQNSEADILSKKTLLEKGIKERKW